MYNLMINFIDLKISDLKSSLNKKKLAILLEKLENNVLKRINLVFNFQMIYSYLDNIKIHFEKLFLTYIASKLI